MSAERVMAIVESETTKADKIRKLNAEGLSRQEIANRLGIRYQHVWNVLAERRHDVSRVLPDSSVPTLTGIGSIGADNTVCNLKTASDGSLLLPSELTSALGLTGASKVVVRVRDGCIEVLTVPDAARRAQDLVAAVVPSERSLVAELIEERRGAGTRGE